MTVQDIENKMKQYLVSKRFNNNYVQDRQLENKKMIELINELNLNLSE